MQIFHIKLLYLELTWKSSAAQVTQSYSRRLPALFTCSDTWRLYFIEELVTFYVVVIW